MKLKEKMESFSLRTHIHGFNELFVSSSKIAKIMWCSLIMVALSTTIYQVASTLAEFIREPTHTEVAHLNEADMFYPPAEICHPHWVTWVDFEKVKAMNFTKSELFYAMTFLDDVIYSSEVFNISETEESFAKKLNKNNLKNLKEFFKEIQTFNYNSSRFFQMHEFQIRFRPISWKMKEMSQYRLCYLFDPEMIKKEINSYKDALQNIFFSKRVIEDRIAQFLISDILLNQQNFDYWLTKDEKEAYLGEIISRFGLYDSNVKEYEHNLPLIIYPNIFVPDEFKLFRNTEKSIYLTSNIFSWKSTTERPCIEDRKRIGENITCYSECYRNTIFDYEILRTGGMVPWREKFYNTYSRIKFLKYGNVTLNKEMRPVPQDKENRKSGSPDTSYGEQSSNPNLDEIASKMKSCAENCDAQIGCDVFSYRISYVQEEKTLTGAEKLYLVYPNSEEAIMYKQINVLTVETLFADVGGLLGIWTGASILTIFQMFYLCCCYKSGKDHTYQENSDNKNGVHKTKGSKGKRRVSTVHM